MEFVNASHLPSHTSQRYNPSLAAACVCPTAPPKRPTNQRTKKNTEPITAVLQKSGFNGYLNILPRINFCGVLKVLWYKSPPSPSAKTLQASVEKCTKITKTLFTVIKIKKTD